MRVGPCIVQMRSRCWCRSSSAASSSMADRSGLPAVIICLYCSRTCLFFLPTSLSRSKPSSRSKRSNNRAPNIREIDGLAYFSQLPHEFLLVTRYLRVLPSKTECFRPWCSVAAGGGGGPQVSEHASWSSQYYGRIISAALAAAGEAATGPPSRSFRTHASGHSSLPSPRTAILPRDLRHSSYHQGGTRQRQTGGWQDADPPAVDPERTRRMPWPRQGGAWALPWSCLSITEIIAKINITYHKNISS